MAMTEYLKRSWAEIDLDALVYNVSAVRSILKGGAMIMGVVKADGYGHGAVQVARKLVQCGAEWLGVSNIEEGEALRRAGLTQPILIFGTTPPELAAQLAKEDLTQAVYSLEYGAALSQAAMKGGAVVNCHIKLDTGMTRLGFLCDERGMEETINDAECVCRMEGLCVGGAFTHFASADECEDEPREYTRMQFARFKTAVEALRGRGIALPICHCANSAATVDYPEMHMDMVRPGIILYGIQPSPSCGGGLNLKPVMSLRSVVASVKSIPAGTQVSYGRTYTAKTEMTVAVVPIGYADGYSRGLSDKAHMIVNGSYANVIGRVCMDQLMLDVTGIAGVKRGDAVTIMGRQDGLEVSADELAGILGTIPYEIACQISKRIARVYLEDGKPVEAVGYIV